MNPYPFDWNHSTIVPFCVADALLLGPLGLAGLFFCLW
jgi:hypothetical protein